MSVLKNLPESLHGPLKSFVNELSSHLEFFNKISFDASSTEEEVELLRKKLEGRFHLIRGAAGFFKLDSLKTLGKTGEENFRAAKGDLEKTKSLISDFLVKAKAEVASTFESLKAELGL